MKFFGGARLNWFSGIASSIWTVLINLAVVPFYLRLLGLEAYGLIGFFATLQGLFALLDLGLSPTVVREVARCRASGEIALARQVLRTLARICWMIAALIAASLAAGAYAIAGDWLPQSSIPLATTALAIALMGITMAVRWPLGLYAGALIGAERLSTVSWLNIAMVTLANAGALAILAFISPTVIAFFVWQAGVGALHVFLVRSAAWRALNGSQQARFDWSVFVSVWKFSAAMGATTVFGIIISQADKVLLSKVVSLDDFAKYSIAALIGRALGVVVMPTFNVVYPRLTSQHARGDDLSFLDTYRTGTRALMSFTLPLASYIAIFSSDLVSIWTGNADLGRDLVWIVAFILLGTALNSAMVFPYAAQLAAGRSQLAAAISGGLLVLFLPTLYLLIQRYGMLGGAMAWAIFNAVYLLVGTIVTHRTIMRGGASRWLGCDVGVPLVVSAVVVVGGGAAIKEFDLPSMLGLAAGAALMILAIAFALLASSRVRHLVRDIMGGGVVPPILN